MAEIIAERREADKRRATDGFLHCPRYDKHELDEDQIELITTRAATKALSLAEGKLYQAVGHGVVSKFLWLVGVIAVSLMTMITASGHLKMPWGE